MTIILSSVVPTTIFAAIFLKERFKLYKLICVSLAMTGIVLVVRPNFLFGDNIENKESLEIGNAASSDERNDDSKMYYYGLVSALTCMTSIAVFRILMSILKNDSTSSTS